eukprot:GHUV01009463.1.p3 GENE.GHUV01009463.1~~GHUV01009463.1.p3  ORF type:complete len:152 (+),score=36.27 GHUV01009463.1:1768-2223(+)
MVQNNKLTTLPAPLGSLKSLRTLNISNNTLQRLPDGLAGCSSLQELDASSNQLSSIPAGFGTLQKLKVLQLDNNNITAVPASVLQDCSELHTLSLHDNPITPAELEATDGYSGFDARRRAKYDRAIGGGALLNSSGMDDGVDRLLKQPISS